jgi:hypothetical protein
VKELAPSSVSDLNLESATSGRSDFHDQFEKEADRAADQVMGGRAPAFSFSRMAGK